MNRPKHLSPAARLCLALACAAATGAGLLWAPAGAPGRAGAATLSAAAYDGRVIVHFQPNASRAVRAAAVRAVGAHGAEALPGGSQLLSLAPGSGTAGALAALRSRPGVSAAVPDYRVHAADFIPNDPGFGGAGGWQQVQWNFAGPNGVNAPAAWDIARHAGAPGGRGVIVAVIDSGVAYENYGRFRRDPDLYSGGFVAPYDFLAGSRHAVDQEGHGTHVASTIAEKTNNGIGLTGLAYDTRIMPLRVLDANGNGDGATVSRAIRYAVVHHARVINLSVQFDSTLRAADIPEVIAALRYANRRGVAVVAASGNDGRASLSYPSAGPGVIAVGASTSDGCLADYSNYGPGMALVAPGGGADAQPEGTAYDAAHCNPALAGSNIVQETFAHNPRKFRLIGFEGTSFATPHVTAAIALLIATRRLGSRPTPAQLRQRLVATARHLGPPGPSMRYAAGLLDIAAALGP